MRIKIQFTVETESNKRQTIEEIATLERAELKPETLGLSLAEAKTVIAAIQKRQEIVILPAGLAHNLVVWLRGVECGRGCDQYQDKGRWSQRLATGPIWDERPAKYQSWPDCKGAFALAARGHQAIMG